MSAFDKRPSRRPAGLSLENLESRVVMDNGLAYPPNFVGPLPAVVAESSSSVVDSPTEAGDVSAVAPPQPTPGAPPFILGVTGARVAPNFVNANFNGKVTLTINGIHFESGAKVTVGDVTVLTRVAGSKKIIAELSGFQNLAEGYRDITVTNPNGSFHSVTGDQGFFVSSLFIGAIEVNQGAPIDPGSALPAVARHKTVIRVPIASNGGDPNVLNPLDVHLRVLYTAPGSTTAVNSLYTPDTNPFQAQTPAYRVRTLADEGLTPLTPAARFYAQDAFNFTFSADQMPEGKYEFRVEIDPANPTAAVFGLGGTDKDHCLVVSRSLVFKESAKVMNIAVMFDVVQPANKINPAFRNSILAYFDYVRDLFPISSNRLTVTVVPAVASYDDFSIFAAERTLSKIKSFYNTSLADATANSTLPYTQVVLFTDSQTLTNAADLGASDLSNWGGLSSPCSIVSTYDAATLGHELGHLFNLGDTYAKPTVPSANNPRDPSAPNGGNAVTPGNYDLYTKTVSVPGPGTQLLDFMGNDNSVNNRWIDTPTWNYLYAIFNSTVGGPAGAADLAQTAAAPVRQLIVSGSVDIDGAVAFDPFVPFTGPPLASPAEGGPYRLELQDRTGKVLQSANFQPESDEQFEDEDPSSFPFNFAFRYPAATAKIVLKKNGVTLGFRNVTAGVPTVQVTSPSGGGTVGSSVSVTWTASDPDGDSLTYDVFHSPDNGANWTPLAVDLTQQSFTWDTTQAPGSAQGKIKVVASDGVNAGTGESAVFTVATKATNLTIVSPADGAAVPAGERILLQGIGFDAQNGLLSNLVWTDNVSGVLGSGGSLAVNLSPGVRQITLTGTNFNGSQVQTTATVTVSNAAGTLSGTVYEDANNNLIFDPGESVKPGVTVFLDRDGSGAVSAGDSTTTTNGSGQYSFAGVTPGTSFVGLTAPSGYAGLGHSVVVPPAGTATANLALQVRQLEIAAPTQVVAGAKFSVSVAVDPGAAFTGSIALSLSDAPTGGKMSGVLTAPVVGNVATFTDLVLDKTGTHTLFAASSGNLIGAPVRIDAVPAPKFKVTLSPAKVVAGKPVTLTITAPPSGSVHYQGTVALSGPAVGLSGLPAEYVFKASDKGVATLMLTPTKAGKLAINVADTDVATAKAVSNAVTVVGADAVSYLIDPGATPPTTGVKHPFTLRALDQFGNLDTNHSSFPIISSDGPISGVPFLRLEKGVVKFTATLGGLGAQSLTADWFGGITTTTPLFVRSTATQLAMTGLPANIVAGTPTMITITPKKGAATVPFAGTLRFTSSDPMIQKPADTAFVAGPNGEMTFPVTFRKSGPQTLTVSLVETPTLKATGKIAVTAGPVHHLNVAGLPVNPKTAVSGAVQHVTITAVDQFDNLATGTTGAVQLTSNDPQFTPVNGNLVKGMARLSATLVTPGVRSVTATSGALTGLASNITVVSAATQLKIAVAPAAPVAGADVMFTVTPLAAANKPDPQFNHSLAVTTSGSVMGQTTANGVTTYTVRFNQSGSQTFAVTDATVPAVKGASAKITVAPAAAARLVVQGLDSPVKAGATVPFTVIATDQFGNPVTKFTDTVTVPGATFKSLANGVAKFTISFPNAGVIGVTPSDTTNPSVTGITTNVTVVPDTVTAGINLPTLVVPGQATGVPGQPLAFGLTASAAGVSPGTAYDYRLNWGDNSKPADASGPGAGQTSAAHAYAKPGTYTITLTVLDAFGNNLATATQQVTISAVTIQKDPGNPANFAVAVGAPATGGTVRVAAVAGVVTVKFNNVAQTVPTSPGTIGRLLVHGQGAKVELNVSGNIPAMLFGGAGSNTLSVVGSTANNVLVGGPGKDVLLGGQGRDILIGGGGADVITAVHGDNILIAGRTAHDGNLPALLALSAEWSRSDRTYQQRIRSLYGNGAVGLNGATLLNGTTVFRDPGKSQVTGGANGLDWYWFADPLQTKDAIDAYENGEAATFD